MKNVLAIIHLPRSSPRVTGLVNYLPEFDWQPIILTGTTSVNKDLPARIIETPYRGALGFLGKILRLNQEKDPAQQIKGQLGISSGNPLFNFFFTLGGAIINYPCPNKNWKPFALEAARKLLREEPIAAVISSSAPVTSHLIASELKKEFDLPWMADLRDLWSQNHNYTYGPVRRLMDKRLEIKTLKTADALATVSEPWAEKLRTIHPGKTVYSISHGFNPAEVNVPPAELTDKFTITYTGVIYPEKQTPSRFFAALKAALDEGTIDKDDIEIRFYGPVEGWLDKQIQEYGLSGIVMQNGQVSRTESVAKQRESQALLFLNWDDPREKGVYSGKIFEYLGARRPILSSGGSRGDVVEELLDETSSGIPAVTEIDIKSALKEMYAEYKTKGAVTFHGVEAKISKYTHREMAGKFAGILDNMLKN